MDIEKWLEKKIVEDIERSLETLTNKNGFICEPNDPSLEINKGSNVFHMEYYRRR
jgi:transcription initiation factor IIE alpha subunit